MAIWALSGHQSSGNVTRKIKEQRKKRDHPDYSTKKSAGKVI